MTTFPQKDQLSEASGITKATPQYAAQATLQYKTFLKRTITEALQNAFVQYADPTLSETNIGPEYQTDRSNFPNIVIKFYERSLKNAGVGHTEWFTTDELETLLTRHAYLNAETGEVTNLPTTNPLFPGKTKVKGKSIPKETIVSRILNETSVVLNNKPTKSGFEEIKFQDIFAGEKYLPYHHYIYNGDVGLEIYGLSNVDRDKVTDAVVEVVGMGTVGPEGLTFQDRIYESIGAENFPYSKWHYIAVNTDLLNDYGEQHMLAPWLPEDTWVYKNEQRFPILGEFYSITPRTAEGALGFVEEIDLYPWDSLDKYDTPPENFPGGVIPESSYIRIRKRPKFEPYRIHKMEPKLSMGRVANKLKVIREGKAAEELPW